MTNGDPEGRIFKKKQIHVIFLFMSYQLFWTGSNTRLKEFFVKVAMEIEKNQDDGSLSQVFKPILDLVSSKCQDFSIMHTEVNRYVDLLMFFTQTESLAKVIL